jgi:hypothetical protein
MSDDALESSKGERFFRWIFILVYLFNKDYKLPIADAVPAVYDAPNQLRSRQTRMLRQRCCRGGQFDLANQRNVSKSGKSRFEDRASSYLAHGDYTQLALIVSTIRIA